MRLSLVGLILAIPLVGWGYHGSGILFGVPSPRIEVLGGISPATALFPEAIRTNPAWLGACPGLSLGSFYSLRFESISLYSLAAAGRHWGIEAVALDGGRISEDIAYSAYGTVASLGIGFADVIMMGASAKLFFQADPVVAFGASLDFGISLDLAVIRLGAVIRNVLSLPIDYGGHIEPWPWGVEIGFSVPLVDLGDIGLEVEGAVGYGEEGPRYGGGIGIGSDGFGVRVGIGEGGIAVGGSLELGGLSLHWATLIHRDLPPTVSAGISWEGMGGEEGP